MRAEKGLDPHEAVREVQATKLWASTYISLSWNKTTIPRGNRGKSLFEWEINSAPLKIASGYRKTQKYGVYRICGCFYIFGFSSLSPILGRFMALRIQYTYGITGHWTQKYEYNNTTVVQ